MINTPFGILVVFDSKKHVDNIQVVNTETYETIGQRVFDDLMSDAEHDKKQNKNLFFNFLQKNLPYSEGVDVDDKYPDNNVLFGPFFWEELMDIVDMYITIEENEA